MGDRWSWRHDAAALVVAVLAAALFALAAAEKARRAAERAGPDRGRPGDPGVGVVK